MTVGLVLSIWVIIANIVLLVRNISNYQQYSTGIFLWLITLSALLIIMSIGNIIWMSTW